MYWGNGRHSSTRAALVALVTGAAVAFGGCGGEDEAASTTPAQLTVDSFCSDYSAKSPAERQEAIARITTELGAPNAGSPQWMTMADQRCAQAPDLKLGDFINHFR